MKSHHFRPARSLAHRAGKAELPLIIVGLVGGLFGGIVIAKLNGANQGTESESAGDAATVQQSKEHSSNQEKSGSQEEVAEANQSEDADLSRETPAERAVRLAERNRKARRTQAELLVLQSSLPSQTKKRHRAPVDRGYVSRSEEDELPPTDDVPRAPNGKDTMEYWNSLNNAIDREAIERGRPGTQFTESSAVGFLMRRVDAGRNAAIAIRGLPSSGVDVQAIQLGRELAKWYEAGAKVADQGTRVLAADAKSRQGRAGIEWKAAERQLQSDVAKINRSAESLRRTLGQRYRMSFPAIH